MMKPVVFILIILSISMSSYAQQNDSIAYQEIPTYPTDYTSGNVIARMIDGLGYRYFWASEGLKVSEMDYKPSDDARSMYETMEHLYGLSQMILSAMLNEPNTGAGIPKFESHEQMRFATLKNLKRASDLILNKSSEEVSELKISFQYGERKSEVPFWHIINGPIADAIYHTGQIVSFRRSVGNPMNPKVNVFMGKTGN